MTWSCFKYHDEKDRRWKPINEESLVYRPELCPSFRFSGECDFKDKCVYAHNKLEIEFHPSKYKTELCFASVHKGDKYCNYAETKDELRTNIDEYERFLPKEKWSKIITETRPLIKVHSK